MSSSGTASSSGYEPSEKFQDAASYLSSAPSLSKVGSSIKLELYGLFKYVTVSKLPNTSRPSIFDMTGRAKWDAWDAAGKKYTEPQDAESRYLEIATSLGWVEKAAPPAAELSESDVQQSLRQALAAVGIRQDDLDLENLSDDEAPQPSSSSAGGGGLGISVSTLQQKPQENQRPDVTIHGLVLANDITALKLLTADKDVDLDELDEYGYAPIHLACDRGHVDVVKFLLSKGAKRDIKDPDGLTPLELSDEAGHTEIVKVLESAS